MFALIIVFTYCFNVLNCYNLDLNYPIVYNNVNNDTYFGYTVQLRPHKDPMESWLLVGAPKDRSDEDPTTNEPGVIYRCKMFKTCHQFNGDPTPKGQIENFNYADRKDGGLLGATMDYQNTRDSFLTCSPRWANAFYKGFRFMNGACYYRNQGGHFRKLLPLIERVYQEYPNPNGEKIYDWSVGIAGMSAQIVSHQGKTSAIIGAPGVYNFKGTAILYDDIENYTSVPIVGHPNKMVDTMNSDYMGYAVSAGRFSNKNDLYYVASAPRANLTMGKVKILTFEAETRRRMNVHRTFTGNQVGEYFGASVTVADVTSDGLDDLIVGAPMWSRDEGEDEGRVFVYIGVSSNLILVPAQELEGTAQGARFGSVVQTLGDLDYDQYHDIAIGAPYEDEGRGAIYIYYGTAQGLTDERRTRIGAADVHPTLRGFGISVSRGQDIDSNTYHDVAVGSFISGNAVILRGRPVIDVELSLVSERLFLEKTAENFTVEACIKFSNKNSMQNLPDQKFIRIISVDAEYGRITLKDATLYRKELILQDTTKSCADLEFKVKSDIMDFDKSIDVTMDIELPAYTSVIGNPLFVDDAFCTNCPVIYPTSKRSISITIPFALDCGDDNICNPDLKVTAQLEGAIRHNSWIIGSTDSLKLNVQVENSGEAAYVSKLMIQIPKPVHSANVPSICQPAAVENTYQIYICDLGDPMKAGQSKNITIPLDMSRVGQFDSTNSDLSDLEFSINATTKCDDINLDNNFAKIQLKLNTEADIAVSGKSDLETYLHVDSETFEELNTVKFDHIIEVQKFGVTPIRQVQLTIRLPVNTDSEEPINILGSHKAQGSLEGTTFECTQSKVVDVDGETELSYYDVSEDEATYSANQLLRRRRQAPAEQSNIGEVKTPAPPENRTYFLNCREIKCSEIVCNIGPFNEPQTIANIWLEMDLNVHLLRPLMEKRDMIYFSSDVDVRITSPDITQKAAPGEQLRPDRATVSTLFVGLPKKAEIEGWVLPVAILVGVLLLLLLVAGLIKAGFFQRKKKEELEALKNAGVEKPPLEVADNDDVFEEPKVESEHP